MPSGLTEYGSFVYLNISSLASTRRFTVDITVSQISRTAQRLRAAFDRGAQWTKQQAADELGCTKRHVLRLVEELRTHGVPVEARREGRAKVFFIPKEHQRRRIQIDALDEAALRALVVSAEAARALLRDTPLQEPLDRAFRTLLEAFGDGEMISFEPELEGERWYFGEAVPPGGKMDVIRQLDRCIAEGRSVRIDYTNGRGERSENRKIDPLAFAPFPSGWQLAAYCHRRQAVRNFNPSRIERLRPCNGETGGDFFAPPPDFDADEHFSGRFGALAGGGRLRTVRLRVEPAVAQYFKTKDYHSSQRLEKHSDGSLTVTFQVTELKTMRAFVRSWGPNVKALEPPELVDALAEDARATARQYESM